MAEEQRNTIGNGVSILGAVEFSGILDFNGNIKGLFKGLPGSTLNIGSGAQVRAEVHVDNLTVEGKIEGTVVVKDLQVRKGGKIIGSTTCETEVVERGGEIVGERNRPEKPASSAAPTPPKAAAPEKATAPATAPSKSQV
jgi:cytoskeletal protein CcmA (bactofilin family)